MTGWCLAIVLALVGPAEDAAARAKKAYDRGDFDAAAAALADAYAADPQPAYLYARAQAERFGGHCDRAVEHYRSFIETKPEAKAAAAAQTNLDECEAELAAAAPTPAPEVTPAQSPDPTVAQPIAEEPTPAPTDAPADPPRPWHRDPLGGALVGSGGLVLAVGIGLYAAAKADQNVAEGANDVGMYGDRIERAATLSRVAIPVMVVGGALLLGGVARWAVVAGRNKRAAAARVGVSPAGLALRF
jgi:tetratricopeptide (TPR) repeat protein